MRLLRDHPFVVAAAAGAAFLLDWFVRPIVSLNIERWAESKRADRLLANGWLERVMEVISNTFVEYIAPNIGPFLLGLAVCAVLFGLQDMRSRRRGSNSPDGGMVTLEPPNEEIRDDLTKIEFGPPQQPLHARSDPHVSWWHIPVSLRSGKGAASIERATVRLVSVTRGGSGISLRWHSRDHDRGVSMQTLDLGRFYLVPVAFRRESDEDERAFITNEDWMLDKPTKRKWPLSEGRHDFWLEIHSGGGKWRSEHMYRITVPPSGSSNGQFTMEVFTGAYY